MRTNSHIITSRVHSEPRTFKRLLVAVDASEQAAAAAEVAAGLARQLGAEVVLLNVYWATCGITPEMAFVEPDTRAGCIETGEALLDRVKERMPAGSQVEKVLREGDPASEIVRTAILYDADLIVMGSHGRGRIAQAVLGSVANAVVRRASCPVLTVAHPLPPPESSARSTGNRTLVAGGATTS